MRMLPAALLSGATLIAVALATPASAVEYPWCADYTLPGGARNCGFVTLEQCRATVFGIGGMCRRNLFYVVPPEQVPPIRRRR